MILESKAFRCDVETSECAWVPYEMIKKRKLNMCEKIAKSIDKVMSIIQINNRIAAGMQKQIQSPQ